MSAGNCGYPDGFIHGHSDVCYLAGRRDERAVVARLLAGDEMREAVAEAVSIAEGEMTAYSETAHPDHNRWSWRGDGHDDVIREMYRLAASAALVAITAALTPDDTRDSA